MGVSVARWGKGRVLVRRWNPTPWETAMGDWGGVRKQEVFKKTLSGEKKS